jgi:hypothetical protein
LPPIVPDAVMVMFAAVSLCVPAAGAAMSAAVQKYSRELLLNGSDCTQLTKNGVLVRVAVGEAVMVNVGVPVGVLVEVGVAVNVGVIVGVRVDVGVTVTVGVTVGVGVHPPESTVKLSTMANPVAAASCELTAIPIRYVEAKPVIVTLPLTAQVVPPSVEL